MESPVPRVWRKKRLGTGLSPEPLQQLELRVEEVGQQGRPRITWRQEEKQKRGQGGEGMFHERESVFSRR